MRHGSAPDARTSAVPAKHDYGLPRLIAASRRAIARFFGGKKVYGVEEPTNQRQPAEKRQPPLPANDVDCFVAIARSRVPGVNGGCLHSQLVEPPRPNMEVP